ESPVIRVEVSAVEAMVDGVSKYEFRALDGSDLPPWRAGAHLDIVVAPEYLRQYSMSGDPADRSKYQIGVLREDTGRGGSALLHRIFAPGRKIFISKPINHFPLNWEAKKTLLFGGGIGVTPMIAMAHEAHARGMAFELHYSAKSRQTAGFLDDLNGMPWRDQVKVYITDEGTRADFSAIFSALATQDAAASHVYACGPDAYMAAVMDEAARAEVPEGHRHLEYFAVPEQPDYENQPFTLRLARSGTEIAVAETETATDALARHGISVDVKCSDGICGVCQCGVVAGDVEHRDFVLSKAQRESRMILCQSRAAASDGVIEIDL
ncbi:MAG: PDR/VanB family oxidoreductase, partial [Pseudomonadota bacterium]